MAFPVVFPVRLLDAPVRRRWFWTHRCVRRLAVRTRCDVGSRRASAGRKEGLSLASRECRLTFLERCGAARAKSLCDASL